MHGAEPACIKHSTYYNSATNDRLYSCNVYYIIAWLNLEVTKLSVQRASGKRDCHFDNNRIKEFHIETEIQRWVWHRLGLGCGLHFWIFFVNLQLCHLYREFTLTLAHKRVHRRGECYIQHNLLL